MSYDYLVLRAPRGATFPLEFADVEPDAPIGAADDVRRAISAVYPAVQWTERNTGQGIAWSGRGGPPEFILTVEADGTVGNFMMSRASVDDVRRLLRAMELIALDLQQETVLGAEP
jgi:hypothetical protein